MLSGDYSGPNSILSNLDRGHTCYNLLCIKHAAPVAIQLSPPRARRHQARSAQPRLRGGAVAEQSSIVVDTDTDSRMRSLFVTISSGSPLVNPQIAARVHFSFGASCCYDSCASHGSYAIGSTKQRLTRATHTSGDRPNGLSTRFG